MRIMVVKRVYNMALSTMIRMIVIKLIAELSCRPDRLVSRCCIQILVAIRAVVRTF